MKQEEYVESGYAHLIASKHIKNGYIMWSSTDQINEFRYKESLEIGLEENDIIFSKDGSLGNPAIIKEMPKPATINSTMMLVRLDKELVSPCFFYQILLSNQFQRLIHLKVSGSSIPHLFQADMKQFKFFSPSLSEQKKIGEFFSKIDRQIELEEKKLALLEEQKKGYMQKIFSQELRFKDENGKDYPEWEEAKIKELFQSVTDKEHSGDLDVLSASQSQGMILRENTNRDISYNHKNLLNYKKTIPGDFIIRLRSFEGGLEYNTLTGLVSPAYTVLIKINNKIDNKYFKYYFEKGSFINRLDSMIYGIRDGKTISFKEFSTFKVQFPRLNEQRKVGMFLNELDKNIKILQQKIDFLKLRKKSLIQRVMV